MKNAFNEWLFYQDGKLFWKKSPNKNHPVGGEAGRPHPKGYLVVNFNGGRELAHRIIYALVTGEDITGWQIDHINGNRTDNRIENLRKVTSAQNGQNRHVLNRNNMTGHHGIFECRGRFYVSIRKDGILYRYSRNTLEKALVLRDQLKENLEVVIPQ